ncbi:hypothetical protein V2J09_000231 [Rumex salicifolius]
MEKVNSWMPSWKILIKRHPGRSFAVGSMVETPRWAKRIINKINCWNRLDNQIIQRFLMIKDNINIITWNVQRAGSREFMIMLKELIRLHNPAILVLVETRLSGRQADKVCAFIGFDDMVLWRKAIVNLNQVAIHYRVVTLEVERSGKDSWLFSAIYASPTPENREELWNHLISLKGENFKPWLMTGDFNETSCMEERTGESDNLRRRCQKFQDWIDDMELIDLGFSGSKYTWARGKTLSLELGLSNFEWSQTYVEASIRSLARNQSDHVSLLLSSKGFSNNNPKNRPFRFQAAWLMHDEF